MKTTQLKYNIKVVSIVCACLLFIAVLKLPIAYYTFLRVIVCIGALLVIVAQKERRVLWTVVFAIIAILFNPIVPIYLYIKAFWIPVDIISGVLFLLVSFMKKVKIQPEEKQEKELKSYSRDKIY